MVGFSFRPIKTQIHSHQKMAGVFGWGFIVVGIVAFLLFQKNPKDPRLTTKAVPILQWQTDKPFPPEHVEQRTPVLSVFFFVFCFFCFFFCLLEQSHPSQQDFTVVPTDLASLTDCFFQTLSPYWGEQGTEVYQSSKFNSNPILSFFFSFV
eukprot:Lithocolla_globosa_v1_NODE_1266_length_2718_cov_8.714608.p2 type:complete len:151 gc:universal NODE_1266_length_2718_cov_8.714608:2434-1982(-)